MSRLTYPEHVYVRTVHELETANRDGALGVDLGPYEKKEPDNALLLKWANIVGRKRYGNIPQVLSVLGHFSKIPFLAIVPAFLATVFLFKLGTVGIILFMSPVLYTVLYFLLRISLIPFLSRLLAESSDKIPLLLVVVRPFLRRHGGLKSLPEGVDEAKVVFGQFGRVYACHPRLYFESFWLVYWLSLSVFVLVLSIFMDFNNMKWEAVQSLTTRTQLVRLISFPFPSWARPDMHDVAYLDTAYRSHTTMLVVPTVDLGKTLSLNIVGSVGPIPLQTGDLLPTKLDWSDGPPDGILVRRKGHWEPLSNFGGQIPFEANDIIDGKPCVIAYVGDKTSDTCPIQLGLEPGSSINELVLTATPDPLAPINEAPTFLGVGSRVPQHSDGRWIVPVGDLLTSESSWEVRLNHGDGVCAKSIRVKQIALAATMLPMADKVPDACKLKWLSFYILMILIYGVGPRIVTLGQAALVLRTHRKGLEAELSHRQYRELVESLKGKQIAISGPGELIVNPLPSQNGDAGDLLGSAREGTLIVDPSPNNTFLDRPGRQERYEIYPDRVGSAPRRREELFEFARSHSFKRIVVCYSFVTNPDESVVLFLAALRKVSGATVEARLYSPDTPSSKDSARLEHWRVALEEGIEVGWTSPENPD